MDGSAFWVGFVRERASKNHARVTMWEESNPPPRVENTGEFLLLATLRPQNGTSLLSPGAAKCVERRGSSWHQEPSSGGMLKDPDMVAGRGGGEASRIAVNQSPMSWIERGL